MEYKITVKNADRYYMGYMVGSNKSLPGPAMHEDDAVFYANHLSCQHSNCFLILAFVLSRLIAVLAKSESIPSNIFSFTESISLLRP